MEKNAAHKTKWKKFVEDYELNQQRQRNAEEIVRKEQDMLTYVNRYGTVSVKWCCVLYGVWCVVLCGVLCGVLCCVVLKGVVGCVVSGECCVVLCGVVCCVVLCGVKRCCVVW